MVVSLFVCRELGYGSMLAAVLFLTELSKGQVMICLHCCIVIPIFYIFCSSTLVVHFFVCALCVRRFWLESGCIGESMGLFATSLTRSIYTLRCVPINYLYISDYIRIWLQIDPCLHPLKSIRCHAKSAYFCYLFYIIYLSELNNISELSLSPVFAITLFTTFISRINWEPVNASVRVF